MSGERFSEAEWRHRRESELAGVRPYALDRIARSGRPHPVYDFLFDYYSHRATHLLRWSPGVGVLLEGAAPADTAWPYLFRAVPGGAVLPPDAFPPHRREYVRWAIRYLEAVRGREPQYGCLGLHEWAMVYRAGEVRHRVPLRLSQAETDAVVDAAPLRCTHYDAFRFFTPPAAPLNRLPLVREVSPDHDQPGCLHANMDLYKFAYKLAPFTSSAVTAEAFLVAVAAREMDMRASPYDLREYGFAPIRVETKDGREEYVAEQRRVQALATPVRELLLAEYRRIETLAAGCQS